jgi:hypothetical protein
MRITLDIYWTKLFNLFNSKLIDSTLLGILLILSPALVGTLKYSSLVESPPPASATQCLVATGDEQWFAGREVVAEVADFTNEVLLHINNRYNY